MQRTIITPADLTGSALSDLKSWLSISRDAENAMLVELLHASVALCEAFTGQMPLVQTVEERSSATAGVRSLSSRPVRSLEAVEQIAQDGERTALAAADFTFSIEAQSSARLDLKRSFEAQAIAIRMIAGIADDWATLPSGLKQGIVRMAAHLYRSRDRDGDGSKADPPPASVAALWRPWRSLRLS